MNEAEAQAGGETKTQPNLFVPSAVSPVSQVVLRPDLESKIKRRKNRNNMTRFSLKCVGSVMSDKGSDTDGVQAKGFIMKLMMENQDINYEIIRAKVANCFSASDQVKARLLFILGTSDVYTEKNSAQPC